MKYLGHNLLKHEYMLYMANFHWYIFIPGIFLYLIAIAIFITNDLTWFLYGIYIIGLAMFALLMPIIINLTTELTITSKRVIYKSGLLSRTTVELNHNIIDSISVNQNILGRILGYGTLIFRGTGGEKTEVAGICKPLEFEKDAKRTIEFKS